MRAEVGGGGLRRKVGGLLVDTRLHGKKLKIDVCQFGFQSLSANTGRQRQGQTDRGWLVRVSQPGSQETSRPEQGRGGGEEGGGEEG